MDKSTILIVDDENINIDILASILCNLYNLKIAKDGTQALKILKSIHVDLILLDIVMPEMDGYEVALKLKQDIITNNIPFIFLTAKSDPQSIVKGFELGAVDYIAKPFVKEELLARVETHLKIHFLNDFLQKNIEELKIKNEEITKKTQEFEMIFSQSYDGIALTDLSTNFLLVNDAYERITGFTKEELYTKSCRELSYDDSYSYFVNSVQEKKLQNVERRCNVNGKNIYVNMSVSMMPDGKTLLLNTKDITDDKKKEEKLKHYVEIMDENIISSSTDIDGKIIGVSKAFEKISGFTKDELIGKTHNVSKHIDMSKEFYEDLWETIIKDKIWRGEIKNRAKDGGFYWAYTTIIPDFDDNGEKIGYTAIRENITLKKKIEDISIHDDLTQLFNRRHFNKVFEDELNRAKRVEGNFLFMMMDVDNFKKYNDHYGHQEGDNVLQQIGKVLNKYTKRSSDYAFRLGGEEFALIAHNKSKEESITLAKNIKEDIEALKIEHILNNSFGYVTISIGLLFKKLNKHNTTKEIYKQSDELLYKAKDSGRNSICF